MKIGTVGGIGVYIHWTFWLLIAAYLITSTASNGLAAGIYAVAFVMSIFACVVLHEFGHAGAAAAFGIPTADITLLPIGGVARLSRLPEKPYQELLIALAGPAVNVVIAFLLLPLVLFGVMVGGSAPAIGTGMDFLAQLLAANIILVLFNLLPAFPMDGGRVLRSLIAMRTGHLRATEIAAQVGRWMAMLFGLVGILYGQFGLVLVAVFVFLAGTAELFGARMRAATDSTGGMPRPPGWQGQVWPAQGTTYTWSSRPQAGSHGQADDVIDAVAVRELPYDRFIDSPEER
jgi:Zn-dependent protease